MITDGKEKENKKIRGFFNSHPDPKYKEKAEGQIFRTENKESILAGTALYFYLPYS